MADNFVNPFEDINALVTGQNDPTGQALTNTDFVNPFEQPQEYTPVKWPEYTVEQTAPEQQGLLSSEWGRGVHQVKADFARTGALLSGIMPGETPQQLEADWLRYAEEQDRLAAELPNYVGQVEDLQSFGDYGKFALGTIVRNLPMLATLAIPGGIVGKAAQKIGLAGAGAYGAGAAAATDMALLTGETTGGVLEKGGQLEGNRATIAGTGALKTALDFVPFIALAKRMGLMKTAESSIFTAMKERGFIPRAGANVATLAATEVPTETMQELLDIMTEDTITQAEKEGFSEEDISRLKNAAAGAAAFSILGVPAAVFKPKVEDTRDTGEQDQPPPQQEFQLEPTQNPDDFIGPPEPIPVTPEVQYGPPPGQMELDLSDPSRPIDETGMKIGEQVAQRITILQDGEMRTLTQEEKDDAEALRIQATIPPAERTEAQNWLVQRQRVRAKRAEKQAVLIRPDDTYAGPPQQIIVPKEKMSTADKLQRHIDVILENKDNYKKDGQLQARFQKKVDKIEKMIWELRNTQLAAEGKAQLETEQQTVPQETNLKTPEPVDQTGAERPVSPALGGLNEREATILARLEEREKIEGLSETGYAQMERLIAKRDGEVEVPREKSKDQKELDALVKEIQGQETTRKRETARGPGMSKQAVEEAIADVKERLGIDVSVTHVADLPIKHFPGAFNAAGMSNEYADGTREIILIPDNIHSKEEAVATYLHEVVGHFGIRSVLDEGQLRGIADALGFENVVDAEEYIARLAENPHYNMSAWEKVKAFFKEVFQKLMGVKLTDGQIRNILRSVELSMEGRVITNYSVQKLPAGDRFSIDSVEKYLSGDMTGRLLAAIPETKQGNRQQVINALNKIQANKQEREVAMQALALVGEKFSWADFVHSYESLLFPLTKQIDYGHSTYGLAGIGQAGTYAEVHLWNAPVEFPAEFNPHFKGASRNVLGWTRVFEDQGRLHIVEIQSDVIQKGFKTLQAVVQNLSETSIHQQIQEATDRQTRLEDAAYRAGILRLLYNRLAEENSGAKFGSIEYKKEAYAMRIKPISDVMWKRAADMAKMSVEEFKQAMRADLAELRQVHESEVREVRTEQVERIANSLETTWLGRFFDWANASEYRKAARDIEGQLNALRNIAGYFKAGEVLTQVERNYISRLIREEMRDASRNGFQHIRVGDADTVATVEGWVEHPKQTLLDDLDDDHADVSFSDVGDVVSYYDFVSPDVDQGDRVSTVLDSEADRKRILDIIERSSAYVKGLATEEMLRAGTEQLYRRYKKEIAGLLKSRFGAKHVVDDRGFGWWEFEIPANTAESPVLTLYRDVNAEVEGTGKAVEDWNSLMEVRAGKWLYTPIQMAKRFGRLVPEFGQYLRVVETWWNTKMNIMNEVNPIASDWNQLQSIQSKRLGEALYEVNMESEKLDRKLTPQETDKILTRLGLDEEARGLFERISKSFDDILNRLEDGLRYNAVRETLGSAEEATKFIEQWNLVKGDATKEVDLLEQYGIETTGSQLAGRLNDIDKDFNQLRNRNYFPHMRFGKYAVTIKATRDGVEYDGKTFKEGQTVVFEAYESAKAQKEAAKDWEKNLPDGTRMVAGVLKEQEFAFLGMPPGLFDSIKDELQLSPQQQEELKEIFIRNSPGRAFLRHLIKRRGVDGFAMDAQRVYATYMMNAANHLARVEHYRDMKDYLTAMDNRAKGKFGLGTDVRREGIVANYANEHYNYIMNPGNDLAKLRGLGFMWYLGFNAKSAVVNLSQIPMVAYPYLASIHGDGRTVAALAKAYPDAAKMIAGKTTKLSENDLEIIRRLREDGLLDESLATELAGFTESTVLERVMPNTQSGRLFNRVSLASAWMFRNAEKYNRHVVALAAGRLAQSQGLSVDEAYTAAREAIQTTQFEYAKWNRPQFMRGKKSVFFLFWQYMQHASFLAFGGHGAKTASRFWLMMALAAGAQGLPFAEVLLDMIDWGSTKMKELTGSNDPYTDSRLALREFAQEIDANPELMMHGLSKYYGLGPLHLLEAIGVPVPNTDVSGSLSLGRPVPGVDVLLGYRASTPEEKFGRAVAELAGPVFGMPYSLWRAYNDNNPDTFKKWERAMPTAVKSLARSLRWTERQEEEYRGGGTVIDFDPLDTEKRAEVIAQAFGFAPTRLGQAYELHAAQEDAKRFYSVKRSLLMQDYAFATLHKNREMLADVKKAIRMFNHSVPDAKLRITPSVLGQSMQERRRRIQLRSSGVPDAKMYRNLYREIEAGFGLPELS